MNCSEIQHYLGDAIDKVLPDHLKGEFHAHLELCRSCRNAYELEMLAKSLVQNNVKRIPAPASMYHAVSRSLQEEYKNSAGRIGLIERIIGSRQLLPTLATGLALAAFLYFLVLPAKDSSSETSHSAKNDVMNQAITSFALVRSGELKPKMISCFPEAVPEFFEKSGVHFNVKMVKLSDCDWYGALTSEYGGVTLAHTVYKLGEETLYVCQVKQNEALQGATLKLPSAAKRELARSGWYTDPTHADCNIILWVQDGTLCAASSTMKKEKLLAMLTTP